MTRAEKWLIVAGAGKMDEGGKGWYDVVSHGMNHAGAVAHDFPTGQGSRYAFGDWHDLQLEASADSTPERVILPDWITKPAPAVAATPKTLSPSELGGAKALPSELGMD